MLCYNVVSVFLYMEIFRCWCVVVWGLVDGECVPPDIGNKVFYRKWVWGGYLSIDTC